MVVFRDMWALTFKVCSNRRHDDPVSHPPARASSCVHRQVSSGATVPHGLQLNENY